MTGKELIDWIKEHHAEDMQVVVQYRDIELGGLYPGCDKELVLAVNKSGDREAIVL